MRAREDGCGAWAPTTLPTQRDPYDRRTASRVLLWCGLAFVGFTISNALVFTDFILLSEWNLATVRAMVNWIATTVLVVALVWDLE